jgi:ATP-dependent Clp protease protease subunit
MTKSKIITMTPAPIDEEDLPVIWVDEFNTETAKEFVKNLILLESNPEVSDIFVHITSFGGGVFAMLSMVESVLACKKPVHTIGSGICASAAATLLACGTGTRWLAKNSYLHIHHIHSLNAGDLPSQKQEIKQTEIVEAKMFEIMTKRSKMTASQLVRKLRGEEKEWQLTAKEAKEYNFIDQIGLPSFKKYTVIEAAK